MKTKKKAMISQPMRGLSESRITLDRDRAVAYLEDLGYEVINTRFTDEWYSQSRMSTRGVVNVPVAFLAKSLENMSLCDHVHFVNGWDQARGCLIEYRVAHEYGLSISKEGSGIHE